MQRNGAIMIEFSQADLFHTQKQPAPTTIKDYLSMGYTPGTAAQLAHLSEHLLRDIGLQFPER